MNLLTLFVSAVYAAETIISPVPADTVAPIPQETHSPIVSFGQLDPFPTLQPSAPIRHTRKIHMTIALLGDSMIDTLGPDAPQLKNHLSQVYPDSTFSILNYGVGGTNIEYGLERITSGYTYLGKSIPALSSKRPDLVVVESFGYNPFSSANGALEKHWLAMAHIVDTIHSTIAGIPIIIAATIAPNASVFGDGAPGLSFSPADKQGRVTVIRQYLENAVKFAQSQHIPIADVYHASLDSSGNGNLSYINGGDHIHYSEAGRNLFAQKVTDTILANRLLE